MCIIHLVKWRVTDMVEGYDTSVSDKRERASLAACYSNTVTGKIKKGSLRNSIQIYKDKPPKCVDINVPIQVLLIFCWITRGVCVCVECVCWYVQAKLCIAIHNR